MKKHIVMVATHEASATCGGPGTTASCSPCACVFELALALSRLRYEVEIVVRQSGPCLPHTELGPGVRRIPIPFGGGDGLPAALLMRYLPEWVRQAGGRMCQGRQDCLAVCSHLWSSAHPGAILARRLHAPHLYFPHLEEEPETVHRPFAERRFCSQCDFVVALNARQSEHLASSAQFNIPASKLASLDREHAFVSDEPTLLPFQSNGLSAPASTKPIARPGGAWSRIARALVAYALVAHPDRDFQVVAS